MDNFQKHNVCINVPSSQNFRSQLQAYICQNNIRMLKDDMITDHGNVITLRGEIIYNKLRKCINYNVTCRKVRVTNKTGSISDDWIY
jgi:hypothetical protein